MLALLLQFTTIFKVSVTLVEMVWRRGQLITLQIFTVLLNLSGGGDLGHVFLLY